MGILKMTEYDEEFESTDAGASLTIPISAGDLKKGGHVLINGRPVKIVELSTSKTGKHGHAKVNITGIDIFTGRKLEDVVPASHGCEEPTLKRSEYQVISVDDEGFCNLMNSTTGECREDLKLPEGTDKDSEVKERIENGLLNAEKSIFCTVLNSMAFEKIIEATEKDA